MYVNSEKSGKITRKGEIFVILELGISVGALGIASLVWSNMAVSVSRYEISADRSLKILHLSDLHKKKFGKDYKKLLDKIPDEKFDFICFTGDLISRGEYIFDERLSFVKKLTELAPVFFVCGNHEAERPENYLKLRDELEKIGVTVLDNETVSFENTRIAGFSSEKRFFRNEKDGFSGLYKIDSNYLKEKLGEKSDEFTILLSHSPFFFEKYAEWGADLTLCGHVHGGVVRLPFVGGVLSPERKFFPKYDGGIYEKNSKKMVVSRGLGKLRLFNPSEIVVIDIKKG